MISYTKLKSYLHLTLTCKEKIYFSPRECHWVCKPHLRPVPMCEGGEEHPHVSSLCCHLRPWWCPSPCCCQGPCLGLWSCSSGGPCQCPWSMSPPKIMWRSLVWAAASDHLMSKGCTELALPLIGCEMVQERSSPLPSCSTWESGPPHLS